MSQWSQLSQYELDLQYAKNILRIRDAFMNSVLDDDPRIIRTKSGYSFSFRDEPDESDEYSDEYFEKSDEIINVQCYDDVGRGSYTTIIDYGGLLIEDGDTHIMISKDDYGTGVEYIYPTEYGEAEHFQQSLIYDEFTNRMILTSWYLSKHPIDKDAHYICDFDLNRYNDIIAILDEYKEDNDNV